MPNYNNGKIYKLISSQTNEIYIGSTVQQLCNRKSAHMTNYRKWLKNEYKYVSSYELCKYDDCKIILVENYSCNSKEELLKREQYYIDNTNNTVNKQRAYSSDEYKKQYDKNKYVKNKDKIKIRSKNRYENNKEDILKKSKIYREKNKDKIRERKSQKLLCECGVLCTRCHFKRHERSKTHQNFMNGDWLFTIDF